MTHMRASHLMTRDVYFVDVDEELSAVWEMMQKLVVRHVPVLEAGRPIGMISNRDIFLRSTLEDGVMRVPGVPVGTVMTTPIVTCLLSASVSAVGLLMLSKKIDSVVIVTELGDLAGMVTTSDFIHMLLEREAVDLMQPPPVEFRLQKLPR